MKGVTGEDEFGEKACEGPVVCGAYVVKGLSTLATTTVAAAEAASSVRSALRPEGAPQPSVKPVEGAPCPHSFVSGTPVWTSQGARLIETLAAGDRIQTIHPESGKLGDFAVVEPSTSHHDLATELTLS